MKILTRLITAFLVCFFFHSAIYAQEQVVKKKVAVYVTGDDVSEQTKKIIGSKVGNAFAKSGNYLLVETTPEFINALMKEVDRQTSGDVKQNQIVSLGQRYGVKYVVAIDITEAFDELYVVSRIINLETGVVGNSTDTSGQADSISQLTKLADNIAAGLLKDTAQGSGSSSAYPHSGGNGAQVETFNVNGVTFEMVKVDGGSFMMGSYEWDCSQPVHNESVGTFYIGKTEVTQQLWNAVMGSNPSNFRGENLPVENVTWFDCQEFVERLSRLTGRIFRLPSGAEWEYAARGGNKSRGYKYSGSDELDRVAWYWENSGSRTHPVAQKLDNELGIFDMSGNVWEWCADNWSSSYNQPRNSSDRDVRGGSWRGAAADCRVAYRGTHPSRRGGFHVGLRLAL